MSHLSLRSRRNRFIALRQGAVAALLFCGLVGLGACSSPDGGGAPDATLPADDVSAEAEGTASPGTAQTSAARANATLNRFVTLSGKAYQSAYQENWQKAAQQVNRLRQISDRLDTMALSGMDVNALVLEIDTLEDAVLAEERLPAMTAANQVIQTGLGSIEALDPDAVSLQTARLAYAGRELELAALKADEAADTSAASEPSASLKQAADQVIQAWDNLDASELGAAESVSEDAASTTTSPEATGSAKSGPARVGAAINTLRQAPADDYAALARRIVIGAQKMTINRGE